MYKEDMKFVDTHEWVKVDNDNVVIVGITNYAQELLGDLVFIELPSVGKNIRINDVVGVVESVKSASDLYSPVSGEVVAVNEHVINDPALANNDPHQDGWLFKVKLDDVLQLDTLMDASQYKDFIG